MGAVFGFTGPPDLSLVERMSGALAHRGSHGTSVRSFPDATICYLARFPEDERVRLGSGMAWRDGRALAVSGYVVADGHPTSPSELLDRYDREGIEFLSDVNGQYVLALRDGPRVFVCRDGAGIRTASYAQHDRRFVFAEEPKAILQVPGFPRRVRPGAVARYLTFSFTPGREKMLDGLNELEAGHYVSVYDGRAEGQHRHFEFESERIDREASDASWVERFGGEFRRAVDERRIPGEPMGVFLSGGIDSSVVAAELKRQHDAPVRSYAIHFGDEYPNELEFARAVARRCGTDHEDVLVRPDEFLPRLRRIIWHLDEPIGDPITVPNYELARRVSRDVRRVFNGEGGDPLFGGPKNIPLMLHHWYGGVDRAGAHRARAYLASYRRAYEDVDDLLSPEMRAQVDHERDLEQIVDPFFRAECQGSLLSKLIAINIRLKGAHLILPKVDRMTAAHGLTALSPLFDERLIRLSFRMPGHMKLARGIEKVVLKEAYRDALPPEVIARPKSGMRVPVHYWFTREMRRYARHILAPARVKRAGVFDPTYVKKILDYDLEGRSGRYGLKLWMLITFEIWRRIFVEGEAP